LSAIGLLDKCLEYEASAVIQTGAASTMGRLMIRLFKENNIKVINVVRREEQVDLLKTELDAEYVLNSSASDFDEKLLALSKELGCKVALECVAGEMPGRIF